MVIQLYGHWNLTITKAIHNWENRFRIEGAGSGNGTYPPTVNQNIAVDGSSWSVIAEYRETDTDTWKPSEMMFDAGLERVEIRAVMGAEDPLPSRDFEDIQWDARYMGDTMLEIQYRPYAVRTEDLFQMPDGIFETAMGTYYMAVNVVNRWGLPFSENHVIDISVESRTELAMKGINIIDSWSQSELSALGQTQKGNGMIIGPLIPGASRTVYFKVDVKNAAPRKHEVEFICRNMAGMADPDNPLRRVRKQIFVSSTTIDTETGEIVSEVEEGMLRLKIKQVAIDRKNGQLSRKKCTPHKDKNPYKNSRERLRNTLQSLLDGKEIDPCIIQEILSCCCSQDPGNNGGTQPDPRKPSDGRFCYDPFYAFPTKFSYTVIPKNAFEGQYGPIPFEDPWWKVLLLIIAAILLLAGMLSEAADVAFQDEDLVIGTLGRIQRDDIDAALCVLDTDRALAFRQTLDAQSNEDFQNAVTSLDGNIGLNGPVMTRAELDVIMTLPATDTQRKVHKSGARTGVTHAIMTGFAPRGHSKSTWTIDQLTLQTDPDFNEPVSRGGDSGSIWVHTDTLRPIALHHSGTDDDTLGRASLLEDVQRIMDITI